MWHLTDPEWIAGRLGIETWQLIAAPIGTVLLLTLLAGLRGREQRYSLVHGNARRSGGALTFVIGFAGGTALALIFTGLWREILHYITSTGGF